VAERYERREKLGEGMFSDVYKAWDRVHDHLVAEKRLSGRTDDRFVKTFIPDFTREVMSLAACRGHPSIVQLLATHVDGNRADGDCFTVTEHAGPMNLRQYMDARRVNGDLFDEDEVRDVMRQLLAGAKHTHGAGVLHRNIVPENVIVGMDGATSKTGNAISVRMRESERRGSGCCNLERSRGGRRGESGGRGEEKQRRAHRCNLETSKREGLAGGGA
jgi:cell division cycle 2-like